MAEAFLVTRQDRSERRSTGPVDARRIPPERELLVLKRIRPDFAHEEAYLRRFVLEAQVASRLEHPNLVRFREFGRVGLCHYIVMEFVRGHSLHRILEKSFEVGVRLPPEAALYLGTGLLDGLSAMHRVRDDDGAPRPMLHRDVTPSNVIVNLDGDPVIIDFGIAKDVNGPAITLPGQVIGTARYMAPEHRRCEYIDARADVFSASVVLFELVVGRHPWPPLKGMKELLRTTFDPPEIPAELFEILPRGILDVIGKGLRCQSEDRWADAEDMRAALKRAAAGWLDPERGRAAVRAFVDALELPLDEALTRPVIDIEPVKADRAEVMWTASGKIEPRSVPSAALDTGPLDASVLTIPPLPPRRDIGVDFSEAEAAALGNPLARLIPWALAGIVSAVGVAYLYHLF